jgi:hypothetical protein
MHCYKDWDLRKTDKRNIKIFMSQSVFTAIELSLRRTLIRHNLERRRTCAAIEKSASEVAKRSECIRHASTKVPAVEECDATGDAMKNYSIVHKII